MIDYQILIEKNPLDNYYKIANRALSELYVDLFGDEAYGHYLANYHSRMKERKKMTEKCFYKLNHPRPLFKCF